MAFTIAMVEDRDTATLEAAARAKLRASAEKTARKSRDLVLAQLLEIRARAATPDLSSWSDRHAWNIFCVPLPGRRDRFVFARSRAAGQAPPAPGTLGPLEPVLWPIFEDGRGTLSSEALRPFVDRLESTVAAMRAECIQGLREEGVNASGLASWEERSRRTEVWWDEHPDFPRLSQALGSRIRVGSFYCGLLAVAPTAVAMDLPVRIMSWGGSWMLDVVDVRSMNSAIRGPTDGDAREAVERHYNEVSLPFQIEQMEGELKSCSPESVIIRMCPASKKVTFGAHEGYVFPYLVQAAGLETHDHKEEQATLAAPDAAAIPRIADVCRSLSSGTVNEEITQGAIRRFSLDEPHRLTDAIQAIGGTPYGRKKILKVAELCDTAREKGMRLLMSTDWQD